MFEHFKTLWLTLLVLCLVTQTSLGAFSIKVSPLARTDIGNSGSKCGDIPITDTTEMLEMTSNVFHNSRYLRILLPDGYRAPENVARPYPVLYFNDGTVVFDAGIYHLEKVVNQLTKTGDVPPIIIVGIDNGACTDQTNDPLIDRAKEFLPYPDVGSPSHPYAPNPPQPQGKLYPRFLIDEVMPFIEKHYRVKTGPSNTGLAGSSYGAVSALYTLINNPGVFGKLLLESPPLWIGPHYQILREAEDCKQWPSSVYLGYGTNEGEAKETVINGERLAVIFRRFRNVRFKYVEDVGAKHDFSAWARRLPEALRFLYGKED
jgi:predicted alpha/beta superfamily hydrolase